MTTGLEELVSVHGVASATPFGSLLHRFLHCRRYQHLTKYVRDHPVRSVKRFLILVCFIATMVDAFTSMLGLCAAARVHTLLGFLFSGVGALIVTALLVSVRDIWARSDNLHRSMRGFVGLAVLVNIVSVLLASFKHIILEKPLFDATQDDWAAVYAADRLQLITILVVTAFLTSAPLAVSHLWKGFFEEEEHEVNSPTAQKPPVIPHDR
jgi:hypothetical protein